MAFGFVDESKSGFGKVAGYVYAPTQEGRDVAKDGYPGQDRLS